MLFLPSASQIVVAVVGGGCVDDGDRVCWVVVAGDVSDVLACIFSIMMSVCC